MSSSDLSISYSEESDSADDEPSTGVDEFSKPDIFLADGPLYIYEDQPEKANVSDRNSCKGTGGIQYGKISKFIVSFSLVLID